MTEVANRRYFEDRINAVIASSRRKNQAITLLYIDIDHLKSINDTHGHVAGDIVITEFSRRLQSCVRTEDLVARLGGDEFAVLVENSTPESGEIIANKIRTLMQKIIPIDGTELVVGASIGVAYSVNAPTANELMKLADTALYSAKSAGRGIHHTAIT
jgi:diguanylate cyclase (GGDEF)-like protein